MHNKYTEAMQSDQKKTINTNVAYDNYTKVIIHKNIARKNDVFSQKSTGLLMVPMQSLEVSV